MARPTLIVAVLVLMALFVAACGGAGPTATAAPTATPTPLPTANPFPPSTIVTFPDENLETAIRDAMGKPQGEEITAEEMAELTELYVNQRGSADLLGIQYCTNLTNLRLGWNAIRNISRLVENSGLGEGDRVGLENNNLDLSEGSEDMENIRQLEAMGVDVRY